MIGATWALEWRIALARRRLLAWNVAVPFLLLAPVATSDAAAPHRAAVLSVFFVMFATFGSCIPLVRDGASGWAEKLLLTGYPPQTWLAERVAGGAALDALQLLPTLLLVLAVSDAGPPAWVRVAGGLALALVAGNLLGAIVAAVVRSLAEGALACAAVSLLSLHLSGAFRSAAPGTRAATAERLSPFAPLHEALVALAGGGPPAAGAGTGGWLGPLSVTLLALAGALVAAPRLGRRIALSAG